MAPAGADDEVDFVVAAYLGGDDEWVVAELKRKLGHDVEALATALDRFPSAGGVLGMVSVDEDWFVLVRRDGTGSRTLLSDVTAVGESELAAEIADLMELPEVDDDADPEPGGDLSLLDDLGVTAADLVEVCDVEDDATSEDMLLDLAERLGFGDELEDLLE